MKILKTLILAASFAGFATGTVVALAALPGALHGVGIVAPYAWEEILVQSAEGR